MSGLTELDLRRPQRADARRNFDALIAAARDVFSEQGVSASLEDVARRAGVGIGTLYRNFPTRQELVEAVYVRSEEHTSELQSRQYLVCRLLLEKKNDQNQASDPRHARTPPVYPPAPRSPARPRALGAPPLLPHLLPAPARDALLPAVSIGVLPL